MTQDDNYDRGNPLAAEIDESAENTVREQIHESRMTIQEFYLRAFRHLAIKKRVRCLDFDCLLIAIGQGKIIGIYSATDVAKLYFVTKAAATECIDDFQKLLKVPPGPGQRGEKGRKKMIQARNSQLETK